MGRSEAPDPLTTNTQWIETSTPRIPASRWVVNDATARALIADGAIAMDARSPSLKAARPFPNAIAVVWQDFVGDDAATKGRLLTDDAILTDRLQALGISSEVSVLVVADAKSGGGEDGRLAWTLRRLGHPAAFLVDGGIDALAKGGLPSSRPARVPGNFAVSRNEALEITKEQLRASIGTPGFVVLDVREPREYAGETPYGESRGGHVPGAKHLFYRDLLDADGYVLSAEQIRGKLSAIGVADGSDIAAYCTGGVRAGFVTAVLSDAGIKTRNYAGSMWEWSAAPADQYPLEKLQN